MQANHEEARQLAEMNQQKSNLSRAYLEHCGALEACDIMLEVRDKMIGARTELLRRALPMLSGAGAGVLASEICECIGMRSNGEVRGASRLAGEASSAEGATSTVVLERGGEE